MSDCVKVEQLKAAGVDEANHAELLSLPSWVSVETALKLYALWQEFKPYLPPLKDFLAKFFAIFRESPPAPAPVPPPAPAPTDPFAPPA
jgi:hypothetical protein